MQKVLIILSLLIFPISSFAQSSFLGRFLSSSMNDSVIVSKRTYQSVLEKSPFTTPLIRDSEIKIRNRAFDLKGQRYSVKLDLRGAGETKALGEFKRSQKNYVKVNHQYALNELLLLRYIYFIDMLERKSLAEGYRDLIEIYEDRIKVMEHLKNSTDFDLTDLIKAEKDLTKLTSEFIEETQEVETANKYIRNQINDSLGGSIDTIGLISVEAIKEQIANTKFELNDNNIYLEDLDAKFQISKSRYELEKAQCRKLISFIEFSYDHGSTREEYSRRDKFKDYNLNNAYILELGIKIPWLSNRNDDVSRRQLDFLHDREDYISLRNQMSAKIKKDESDIRAYIKRYDMLTIRETEADAEASLKKYLELSGVDPIVLLTIQESLIKNRIEKEKVYFSILRNYIYVMDVTGKLIEEPLRNYLSAHNETLKF